MNREAQRGAASRAMPKGVGAEGRRTLIKGGTILSMDERVGDHATGDVLIEGSTIAEIAPSSRRPMRPSSTRRDISSCRASSTPITISSRRRCAAFSPTASSSTTGGRRARTTTMKSILQKLSMGYRPQDVFVNELFAGIAQIDAGVTGVMDVSQIHHSPEHSDAAIEGLRAAGRRAVFGYFEGWGDKTKYPGRRQAPSRTAFFFVGPAAQHVHGRRDLPSGLRRGVEGGTGARPADRAACGRHVRHAADLRRAGEGGKFGSDCFFIHMTGMSDMAGRRRPTPARMSRSRRRSRCTCATARRRFRRRSTLG